MAYAFDVLRPRLRIAVVLAAIALIAALWLWPSSDPPAEAPSDFAFAPHVAASRPRDVEPRIVLAALPGERPQVDAIDEAAPVDAGFAGAFAVLDGGTEAAAWFAQNAKSAEELVETYCEESRKLKDAHLGAGSEGSDSNARDAASYLSVRVDWENGMRPPGLLHLPEALHQRMLKYGADWPTRVTDSDLSEVSFGWLKELAQFNQWSPLADGPARDAKQPSYVDAPIPNLVGFQEWAKLRYALALHTGDFLSASTEIRHLVALLHTTTMLIAEAICVVLLRYERTAFEVATARGMDVSGWQPFERADLERYRRVAFASPSFLFPGVPARVSKRALDCMVANPCMASNEATGMHSEFGHLSAVDTTAGFQALVDALPCDAKKLQWLRRSKPATGDQMTRSFIGTNYLGLLQPDGG